MLSIYGTIRPLESDLAIKSNPFDLRINKFNFSFYLKFTFCSDNNVKINFFESFLKSTIEKKTVYRFTEVF